MSDEKNTEDVEGHHLKKVDGDEDVQGHWYTSQKAVPEDEDVEGHHLKK